MIWVFEIDIQIKSIQLVKSVKTSAIGFLRFPINSLRFYEEENNRISRSDCSILDNDDVL